MSNICFSKTNCATNNTCKNNTCGIKKEEAKESDETKKTCKKGTCDSVNISSCSKKKKDCSDGSCDTKKDKKDCSDGSCDTTASQSTGTDTSSGLSTDNTTAGENTSTSTPIESSTALGNTTTGNDSINQMLSKISNAINMIMAYFGGSSTSAGKKDLTTANNTTTSSTPTGTTPTGTVPLATQSYQTAVTPTAKTPTGTVPTGTVPTGTVPLATQPYQTAFTPTATTPTGTVPTGTVPLAIQPYQTAVTPLTGTTPTTTTAPLTGTTPTTTTTPTGQGTTSGGSDYKINPQEKNGWSSYWNTSVPKTSNGNLKTVTGDWMSSFDVNKDGSFNKSELDQVFNYVYPSDPKLDQQIEEATKRGDHEELDRLGAMRPANRINEYSDISLAGLNLRDNNYNGYNNLLSLGKNTNGIDADTIKILASSNNDPNDSTSDISGEEFGSMMAYGL